MVLSAKGGNILVLLFALHLVVEGEPAAHGTLRRSGGRRVAGRAAREQLRGRADGWRAGVVGRAVVHACVREAGRRRKEGGLVLLVLELVAAVAVVIEPFAASSLCHRRFVPLSQPIALRMWRHNN